MRYFYSFPIFCLTFIYFPQFAFGQIPNLPTIDNPNPQSLFSASEIVSLTTNNKGISKQIPQSNNSDYEKLKRQNETMIKEVNRDIDAQIQAQKEQLYYQQKEREYAQTYLLTPLSDKAGTSAYYSAFENLSKFNPDNFSIADATFVVENAFSNNDKDLKATFQNSIQKAVKIINGQLEKNSVEQSDNMGKNLTLFRYFSEDTKQNGKILHKAVKYDFDDYFGTKDFSKMFVSKLMKTGMGQCHSMPLLYLILAEQIGAEAYLVMSPNHSYIRFPDDEGNLLSIELTNGMFSASSFVLNSGFIKSEALQSKIYMQNLNRQELLSQTFADMASGYIHKFGYDEFADKVVDKALNLNPHNITAHLLKSNIDQKRFEQACNRLGINPNDKNDLQRIGNYPILVNQLGEINRQYDNIEQMGYAYMPSEDYEKWLGSLKQAENQQMSDNILERMKAIAAQKSREASQKRKTVIPKKDAPKTYQIPKELL